MKQLPANLITFISLFAVACGGARPAPAVVAEAPPPEPVVVQPPPPPAPVAQLQDNRIVISEMVRFEEDSEALHADSNRILDEVVGVLQAHPEITHLRIEGNTDNLGAAEHNEHLSHGRATTVAHYLHEHGVPETVNLEPVGFGSTRPLCTDDTDECRAQNRRVDFVVPDPAEAAPTPAPAAPPARARGRRPAAH